MKNLALVVLLIIISNLAVAQPDLSSVFAIGDAAPSFEGINQHEETISSEQLLEEGAIVLIFYRGEWCPYCKKHLSELEESLSKFKILGANVVVVTPEQPDFIDKMIKKTDASYSIIYDKNYSIMESFCVKFEISKETVPKFYNYVLNGTRKSNGNEEGILPIPATYVINKEGIIDYIHFDPDYKTRSSMEDILTHLNTENGED